MRLYKCMRLLVFVVVAALQVGCAFFNEQPNVDKNNIPITSRELAPLQEGENFIVVTIGGYSYGTKTVFIDFNKGRYIELFMQDSARGEWKKSQEYEEYIDSRSKKPNGIKDFKEKQLSVEEISFYRKALEEVKIYNWKDKYIDQHIMDGTQWSVSLSLAGNSYRYIYGSNKFPKEWESFSKAFSYLQLK